ncbi:MAG TPA: heavy metal translocating P-type ATPase [archaeon]|nr:heavy metal translocating P-type ATPase [archaeon]
MAKDVVCGMYVDENKTPFKIEQDGIMYYFCSDNCLKTFLKPQVEMKKLKYVAIFSLVIGSLTALFEYVYMIDWFGIPNYIWLFLLATPVQFIGGWRFYLGTRDAIKAKQANMDTLIAIGTTAAWVYSTIYAFQGILWSTIFPKVTAGGPEVYFTESGLIIGFILLGKYLEHIVKGKASHAIRKLMDLQPKMATVVRNGKEEQIPVEQVKVDDIIIIKPGEKIPVDGEIVEGYSAIDQSAITGESMPVTKKVGDEVIGATINKSGLIKVKATKVGTETTLSQIVKMVQEAIVSRAPMQRLADKVSSYFVPAVIIISVGSFLFWYFVVGLPFSLALTILIAVLIIACPCALGIATPAAIMIGAGKGAQNGILIKSGEYLEKTYKLDAIIFDKTGTLTKGEPTVTDIVALSSDENDVLQLAAMAEKGSEHPIGEAILKKAEEKKIKISELKGYETVAGKGIKAIYMNKTILVGNRMFMKDNGIDSGKIEPQNQKLEEEGKTAVIVSYGEKIMGIIAVADTAKEFSREAVEELKKMKKEVWMITGDNERTAKAVAKQLGIENVMAQVLPQDKAMKVKELQQKRKIVAAVGDGINDAPMLAQADVGIAVGAGTDIAKETGGIVLIKNDLRDVVTSIDLSRKTVRKMKENLFWAFIYNVGLIPIAAGILYPFLGILLNPIYAAIAMASSSITVVSNSMLLNRYKPKIK